MKGWGRANSGEAADQGPESLWWNPASIGGTKEKSSSFGATIFLPVGEASDQGTLIDRPGAAPGPVGGEPLRRDPVRGGAAPNSAFALPLGKRLAIGLAITSPFSFTSDYSESGWQRYSAIHSRLTTIDVQPSAAWMPTSWLSLGAAINVEYADASLSNALPNLAPGSADGRVRLKGHGWDLGWSAGAQLRPSDRVTIGIAYKSAIEHKLGGSVEISGLTGALASQNVLSDTSASFSTPWQLIMGVRGGISRKITLNAQAVRFGWSRFDRITLAAPLNSVLVQDYKNSWSFAFGVDDAVSKRLTLRAGVQLDATPTRDESRNARVPDGDRVDYNVGASLQLGRRFVLDAAAAYTDFENVPISRDESFYVGGTAQTDIFTAGRASRQHAIVIAMGGRMRF